MKRNLLICLMAILLCFPLGGCMNSHNGDASSVKVDLSASDGTFSDEELMSAVDVIKQEFLSYTDCTLMDLTLVRTTRSEAIFKGTFRTGPRSADEGFVENEVYPDWEWSMSYDSGQWTEISHGYG